MVRNFTIALAAGATLGASVALTPTEASAQWWYPGYSAYGWYPAYYAYAYPAYYTYARPVTYSYTWAWRPYTFAYYAPVLHDRSSPIIGRPLKSSTTGGTGTIMLGTGPIMPAAGTSVHDEPAAFAGTITFWEYLGSRLAVPNHTEIPYLPTIVRHRCATA